MHRKPPLTHSELTMVPEKEASEKMGRKAWKYFRNISSLYPVIIFVVLSFSIAFYFGKRLPTPILLKDLSRFPSSFNTERAKGHLDRLSNIGPRPSGSYECEIRTLDMIKRELEIIKHISNPIHSLKFEVQQPSGVFASGFLEGLVSKYEKVTNMDVRVGPKSNMTDGILVNCHFDSVAGSPGASDNILWCAVMLEALEVIVRNPKVLKNSIVFLFNGAEENGLQAAHGFITQHHWRSNLKTFINLDSCGAGGRDILFQTDPSHRSLFEAYASSVPHPFGNVFGQEVFEYGLIPSDTDYRIFKEFGKIPGFDFAFFKNGYVYHTKHDSVDKIPLGTIQRAGDNILALLQVLGDADLEEITKQTSKGFVFFDFLGLTMVSYSQWFSMFINTVVSGGLVYQVARYTKLAVVSKKLNMTSSDLIFAIAKAGIISTAAFVIPIGVNWMLSRFLLTSGAALSWFSRPWLIIPLYVFPAVCFVFWVYRLPVKSLSKVLQAPSDVVWIQFVGFLMCIDAMMLLLSFCGIRSSVLFLPYLMSGVLFLEFWHRRYGKRVIDEWWSWSLVLAFLLPSVQTLYVAINFFAVLIPVGGRSGPHVNPDVIIACFTAFVSVVMVSFLAPLQTVNRLCSRCGNALLLLSVAFLLLIVATPLGFPFSGEPATLAPQRVQIMHVEKIEWDRNGRILQRDAGFWFPQLDIHGPKSLIPYVPQLSKLQTIDESRCHEEAYCGVPYYFSSLRKIRKSYWLPAPTPLVYIPSRLVLESNRHTKVDIRRLTFTVTGPDHMAAMVWPSSGVELVSWSFNTTEKPKPDPYPMQRPIYFVYYASGAHGSKWDFWIDLKMMPSRNPKDPLVEIVLTSHFLHGEEQTSQELRDLMKKFPPFTYTSGWVATYNLYEDTGWILAQGNGALTLSTVPKNRGCVYDCTVRTSTTNNTRMRSFNRQHSVWHPAGKKPPKKHLITLPIDAFSVIFRLFLEIRFMHNI